MLAKFVKKFETCAHGGSSACPRCAMEDLEDGVNLYLDLDKTHVHECIAHLNPYVNDRMREHTTDILLAGGFVRDAVQGTFQDIDLFTSERKAREIARYISKSGNAGNVIEKDGVFSVKWNGMEYQFHHGYTFKSVEDLLNQFDLSIARAAIWYTGKEWTGVAWHSWARDIASKSLVYLSREPEIKVALRLLRFTARGYSIDVANLSRMLTSIVGSTPSGMELDLGKLEHEIIEGFKAAQREAKVEASPFRRVEREWDTS